VDVKIEIKAHEMGDRGSVTRYVGLKNGFEHFACCTGRRSGVLVARVRGLRKFPK
jgi:hypothetical protein